MNAHAERYLSIIKYTVHTLAHLVSLVTPDRWTTARDGEEGWTALEVLCHLRDFDEIFYQRALSMRDQDTPHFTAYDHEQMAIDARYNEQELLVVIQALLASRARFVAFFESLSEDDWQRAGVHPERGAFTMMDSVAQVATHDTNHIEQITRILTQ